MFSEDGIVVIFISGGGGGGGAAEYDRGSIDDGFRFSREERRLKGIHWECSKLKKKKEDDLRKKATLKLTFCFFSLTNMTLQGSYIYLSRFIFIFILFNGYYHRQSCKSN